MGLAAEFLVPEPRLIQAAGGGTGQIFPQEGVDREHGEGFLGEEDLAAGLLLHLPEDLQILPELFLVDQEIGGGDPAP